MRAVLAAGSKSPSHLHATMERYGPLLATLTDACPDRTAAQITLLQQAADFYSVLPQKVSRDTQYTLGMRCINSLVAHAMHIKLTTRVLIGKAMSLTVGFTLPVCACVCCVQVLMSFDRLMALRLATPAAVAEWATSLALPAALRAGNGVAVSSACEVLQYALDRCLAVSNETLEKR